MKGWAACGPDGWGRTRRLLGQTAAALPVFWADALRRVRWGLFEDVGFAFRLLDRAQ